MALAGTKVPARPLPMPLIRASPEAYGAGDAPDAPDAGTGGMVPYLTAKDIQELIRVDKSTIYRMAEDGRLPAVKVGRQWRFPEDAVLGWLGIDTGGAVLRIEHNLTDLVTPGVATAVAE